MAAGFSARNHGYPLNVSIYVLQLPRRPESVPEARAFVRSALVGSRVSATRANDLLIAVSEACSNVVTHASSSEKLRVEVRPAEAEVRVVVSDQGTGFDAGEPEMPAPDDTGGRGLALMSMLCDDVQVLSGADGTQIELLISA